MKLLSRHYGMRRDQVHAFDYQFLIPIIDKLDVFAKDKQKKYQFCHSHYLDHKNAGFRHFTTFRLYAPKTIKDYFMELEDEYVKELHYFQFNRDAELKKSPQPLSDMTFKQLADIYYISEEEMEMAFKLWHLASLLKLTLLKLWGDGNNSDMKNIVHYALNSLGMEQEETLEYNEERAYRDRNFPQPKKVI